ncbi:MAG: hypothetical protein ACI8RD_007551 [Bacillariaceae sp.]|jgi:hypothetical protein
MHSPNTFKNVLIIFIFCFIMMNNKKRNGHIHTVTMDTFGMAHGKEGKNDLWLECVEQGVPMLRQYLFEKDKQLLIEQQKTQKKGTKNPPPILFSSWMDLVPLDEFHVTQGQFLKAFLKWSIKDKEDIVDNNDNNDGPKLIVNASKARRRLDSYLDWMKDNMAKDLSERPLTLDSVMDVAKVWDLQTTVSKDGQLIWWMDVGAMDRETIKATDPHEQLRYLVWYCHLIMFDTNAQDHGVIMMEDLNKMGFWNAMTLIPIDVSAKMDRLTIGVLPVKMKGVYMFGAARWLGLMMTMMKPFLSKKMRDRIVIITETIAPDRQKYCDELFGRENIPEGCMDLHGDTPHDAMFAKLEKKGKKKAKKAKAKDKGDGEESKEKKKKEKKVKG